MTSKMPQRAWMTSSCMDPGPYLWLKCVTVSPRPTWTMVRTRKGASTSDPEIASLVQRGLLNPRRLSDPAYAADLRKQTLRRESQVDESGNMMYGTSTSRPNTLHRGRIARAAVPVFEREGPASARSGLKYYRRRLLSLDAAPTGPRSVPDCAL